MCFDFFGSECECLILIGEIGCDVDLVIWLVGIVNVFCVFKDCDLEEVVSICLLVYVVILIKFGFDVFVVCCVVLVESLIDDEEMVEVLMEIVNVIFG